MRCSSWVRWTCGSIHGQCSQHSMDLVPWHLERRGLEDGEDLGWGSTGGPPRGGRSYKTKAVGLRSHLGGVDGLLWLKPSISEINQFDLR